VSRLSHDQPYGFDSSREWSSSGLAMRRQARSFSRTSHSLGMARKGSRRFWDRLDCSGGWKGQDDGKWGLVCLRLSFLEHRFRTRTRIASLFFFPIPYDCESRVSIVPVPLLASGCDVLVFVVNMPPILCVVDHRTYGQCLTNQKLLVVDLFTLCH
jgi:hypothetical protein